MNLTRRHIPFERLADLAEGRPDTSQEQEESTHLAQCANCASQYESLLRLTSLMRTDASADAPRDLISAAVELFRTRAAVEQRPSVSRRLVAALLFDSGAHAPAYGLRSGTAAARQLLFTAGELDVDLRLSEGPEGWAVTGQVLGPCEGGRAEAYAHGCDDATAGADLNHLCEFMLPPLAAGDYTLRLRLNQTKVEIPGLRLRN
jgi:hypothetical protein